jgi:two-component system, NarL family, sensor kinase
MKRILVTCTLAVCSIILLGQSVEQQFDALIDRGRYLSFSDPDSAIKMFKEALKIAKSVNNDSMMVRARTQIAYRHFQAEYHTLAIQEFLAILDQCVQTDNNFTDDCSFATMHLGILYKEAGLLDSALYYFQLSIEFDEQSEKFLRPEVRSLIGSLYLRLGKQQEAEFYVRKNYDLNRDSENIFKSIALFFLAQFYLEVNNVDSFGKYNLEYLEILDIESMDAETQQYHYEAMFEGSDGTRSTDLLESALSLLERQNAIYYVRAVNVMLGDAYQATGRYAEAFEASEKAFEMAVEQMPAKLLLQRDPLLTMFEAKKSLGQYGDALNILLRLNSLDSTLSSERSKERIDLLEIQFRTAQKEKEILNQQIEISKRTGQRNLFVIVGITLLLGVLALWQKLISNRKLAKQNAIIKEQKILTLKKENKILAMDAMITGQEEERKRIAKDLHDGLGGILSTVKLSFEAIDREIARLHAFQPYEKAITMLDDACDEVRRIAHDMMPSALSVGGLPDAIEDLGESLRSVHGIKTDVQIIGLEVRLEENVEVMLYRILQELVMNVIKHAGANKVILQLSRHDDNVMVVVEDDGVGFVPRTKSDGLGLKSLQSRVEYLNGEMTIDSEGQGTTVLIVVPV